MQFTNPKKSPAPPGRHIPSLLEFNPKLADFVLREKKFTIEVAGPFGAKEIGLLVETAVMSALDSDFNVAKGQSHARFRPLGVPDDYAERLSMPALQRNDFIPVQKDSPMPVLFVIVGEKDFGDGRAGYDLANPPADAQILERVEKWRQLSGLVPHWAKIPPRKPRPSYRHQWQSRITDCDCFTND